MKLSGIDANLLVSLYALLQEKSVAREPRQRLSAERPDDCTANGTGVKKQVADCVMPEKARVLVLVAHPDDETLWAGGTLLMHGGWATFIGTLCRAGDEDRAAKFFRALDHLGAKGAMADLDDGPAQVPLGAEQVRATLLSLVPKEHFDLILTHAPKGEYTRHLRHEEVSRSVLRMWACGEIQSRELWLFAYEDGGGRQLPHAEDSANILVDLSDEVWTAKRSLLTEIYGFVPDSWEVQTTPRREAYWRLVVPDDAWAWLERARLQ
jgi:LmbE family N-acetylglucosaminyl deacetylase